MNPTMAVRTGNLGEEAAQGGCSRPWMAWALATIAEMADLRPVPGWIQAARRPTARATGQASPAAFCVFMPCCTASLYGDAEEHRL
jgi:hypothetical protein